MDYAVISGIPIGIASVIKLHRVVEWRLGSDELGGELGYNMLLSFAPGVGTPSKLLYCAQHKLKIWTLA